MTDGHGDDLHQYDDIRANFSSNVYAHFDHSGLTASLAARLPDIVSYPQPTPRAAERAVAAALGLSADEVIVTSGATEAIYLAASTFRGSLSVVVTPTFSEYADACRMYGHRVVSISALAHVPHDAQLVWLCNPNNPTGTTHDKADLLNAVDARPDTLFVIDASYAHFTRRPVVTPGEAVGLRNVLMLHSMTKTFAVPGLRIGYVTGNPQLLGRLRSHRAPWTVNSLAQHACEYLMAHRDDYVLPVDSLLQERQRVSRLLAGTGRVAPMPSDTHMLLCRLVSGSAGALKDHLARREGLLIRDASNFDGLDDRYFRIAVQTAAENDRLVAAIDRWTAHEADPENHPTRP